MNDPRLNSVHLDFPRREDFRRWRDLLLDGRGNRTIALECSPFGKGESHTFVQDAPADQQPNADHWLIDQEGICLEDWRQYDRPTAG